MSDIGGALREIVRMSANRTEVADKIMALWNIPHQYQFQVFAHAHKDVCLETFLEHLTADIPVPTVTEKQI
jgi:hypothetical protein